MNTILGCLFESLNDELIAVRVIQSREVISSHYVNSVSEAEKLAQEYLYKGNVFFGVCTRKSKGAKSKSVARASCIWADIDGSTIVSFPLKPTVVVSSGKGTHAYWVLKEPTTNINAVCEVVKAVAIAVDGDQSVGDSTRLLRIDGTLNHKYSPPKPVEVVSRCTQRYTLGDISAASSIPIKTMRKISSGDSRGYKTRSERDWAVIQALINLGFSDEGIEIVFDQNVIGDKSREENGDKYLSRSIEKARSSLGVPQQSDGALSKKRVGGFFERDSCYWRIGANGASKLSTFVFNPKVLLRGDASKKGLRGNEDVLLGDIHASGATWKSIAISKGAFTRIETLLRELPRAEWQWIGNDREVRILLPYLVTQLKEMDLPARDASSQIGASGEVWLGKKHAISKEGKILDFETSPVVLLPTNQERPKVSYREGPREDVREFFNEIHNVNRPQVVWPILGWTAACTFKMKLEKQGYRFPSLNLYGTRGSGKTSMITGVVQRLMGYDEPRTYDCGTTQFVMLSLFGCSSSVPIAFSEFRRSSLRAPEKILRYLLLAYDSGHDPRGRADQSVVDYILSAPVSVDGEDAITDAAALERLIQVNLHPEDIQEDSRAFKAFERLRAIDLKSVGTRLIATGMREKLRITEALQICQEAFPQPMPDRIRRNIGVVVSGLLCLQDVASYCDSPFPVVDTLFIQKVFEESLEGLMSSRGRTLIIADEFIEDIINDASHNGGMEPAFAFRYDEKSNTMWFHLATALGWWYKHRRAQGRPTLESSAIKSQLKERIISQNETHPDERGQYIVGRTPKVIDGSTRHCYGVSLNAASNAGLDVPSSLNNQFFFTVSSHKETKDAIT